MDIIFSSTVDAHTDLCQKQLRNFLFDGYVCGCGTEVIFHGETLYHYDLDDSLKRSLDDILTECKIQVLYAKVEILAIFR